MRPTAAGPFQTLTQKIRSAPQSTVNWWNKPGFWVLQLGVFLIVGVFIWLFITDVAGWYEWLWLNTTRKPYTHIMRDMPWLLALPGLAIFGVAFYIIHEFTPKGLTHGINPFRRRGLDVLRERLLTRVIFLLALFTGLGFIFGHVFWGADLRESRAFHEGVQVKLWVTGVSSSEGFGAELRSWLGSQVVTVPRLQREAATDATSLYIFTNGQGRRGSLGFRPDVLDSAPGDPRFTQTYRVYTARWRDGVSDSELISIRDVEAAIARGELNISPTDVIVNGAVKEWGQWGQ